MIASLPCEVEHKTEADWLAWRQDGIGASNAAAALGVSPYQTPFELWARKTGQLGPIVENRAMTIGKLAEPMISALYRLETGDPIVRREVSCQVPGAPWIKATLDGISERGTVVEFKTANSRMSEQWGEPGTDEIPTSYLVQCHTQLLCSDAPFVEVACLIGGDDFRLYRVDRDREMDAILIRKLTAFWTSVIRREPPEVTEADAEIITKLRPTIEATITLDDRAVDLANLYVELGLRAKDDQDRRDQVKADLCIAMDGHAAALLPDGRVITRKVVERAEYTCRASSYVDFRIKTPKGGK